MHITMVKKRMKDGAPCGKCVEATEHLQRRGLLDRIDEVVWAVEDDPESPGMVLGARFGIERAPFFIVRDGANEHAYTSVLSLIQDRFRQPITDEERARGTDPDEIGGI